VERGYVPIRFVLNPKQKRWDLYGPKPPLKQPRWLPRADVGPTELLLRRLHRDAHQQPLRALVDEGTHPPLVFRLQEGDLLRQLARQVSVEEVIMVGPKELTPDFKVRWAEPPPIVKLIKTALAATAGQKTSKKQQKDWVEIVLTDDEGKPVPNAKYEIKLPDGSKKTGTLDGKGKAKIQNVPSGTCTVTFPDTQGWG
jgi:hypothetical protein